MFRGDAKKRLVGMLPPSLSVDRKPMSKVEEDDYIAKLTTDFQATVESVERWFIDVFLMNSKFHNLDKENIIVMELWLDCFLKNRIMPCEQKSNKLHTYFKEEKSEDYYAATFVEYSQKLKDTKAFVISLSNRIEELRKKSGLSHHTIDTTHFLLFAVIHNATQLFNKFVTKITLNKNLYLVVKKLI